jgi:hypothetical protein
MRKGLAAGAPGSHPAWKHRLRAQNTQSNPEDCLAVSEACDLCGFWARIKNGLLVFDEQSAKNESLRAKRHGSGHRRSNYSKVVILSGGRRGDRSRRNLRLFSEINPRTPGGPGFQPRQMLSTHSRKSASATSPRLLSVLG